METPGPTYSGKAYHPDLGNQLAEGELMVSQWTLHFRSEELTLDFPLTGLSLDVPKEDDQRILFIHPLHPGWRIYTDDFGVFEDRNITNKSALREQIERIAERTHNWRRLAWVTLGVFGAFMLLMCGVFLVTGWTLNFVVGKVPPTYEKKIGDDVFNEIQPYVRFVKNTNTLARVEGLAKRFIPPAEQQRFDFRFYIIESETPNAMALPGGIVLVTTGLLKMADPEELAGVLAHEVAHVTRRHGVKQVASQVGPYLLLKAFLQNDKGFLGLIGHGSRLLVSQNFSQKYETEADAAAWDYMVKANINPQGLINFFRKLEHVEPGERKTIRALASHPPNEERIRRLEKRWNALKNKTGFIELEPVGRKVTN